MLFKPDKVITDSDIGPVEEALPLEPGVEADEGFTKRARVDLNAEDPMLMSEHPLQFRGHRMIVSPWHTRMEDGNGDVLVATVQVGQVEEGARAL